LRAARLFAFALPALLFAFYFVAARLIGIWWAVHLWAGAIILSGLMGWLVSYLLLPSPLENVRLTE
jgi:hypothetical protein